MSKNKNIKKLRLDSDILLNSLFRGMKSADDLLTTNNKENTAPASVEEKIEIDNVYASLVKGEITQEVKDLRYETYEAARKASEYRYVGNGVAVKKNTMLKNVDAKVENEDGLKVVLVQINQEVRKSVNETFKEIERGREEKVEHRLKVKRKYYSRFNIEDYATQLVVKELDDKNYVLDFYIPMEPVENDTKSIFFSQEVNSLYKSGSRMSDIFDIDNVSFITEKAYPILDLHSFSFINLSFIKMLQYNGSFIIRFTGTADKFNIDEVLEFHDKESVRKFKENAPREKKKGLTISFSEAKDFTEKPEEKIDTTAIKKITKKIKRKKK